MEQQGEGGGTGAGVGENGEIRSETFCMENCSKVAHQGVFKLPFSWIAWVFHLNMRHGMLVRLENAALLSIIPVLLQSLRSK